MVDKSNKSHYQPHFQRKKWRYFYYGDDLHRMLSLNRATDELVAFNYPQRKRMLYSWMEVKRNGQPSFSMKEAAKITGRSYWRLYRWIYEGWIPTPQRSYSLETGNLGPYYFSHNDIMNIFEVIKSTHRGRPRADGAITNSSVPNEKELRAALTNSLFVYAQNANGEFVPIWEAEADNF